MGNMYAQKMDEKHYHIRRTRPPDIRMLKLQLRYDTYRKSF